MSNAPKDEGQDYSQENLGSNGEEKPQSYGTETVLKGLNPSKPLGYGIERIIQSKGCDSDMEGLDE